MIRVVLNVISVLLLSLIISCSNNSQENTEKEQDTSKQEMITDTLPDTVAVDVSEDIFSTQEETSESSYLAINYIEDFMKFKSNEQVENYFGKENVKYQEMDYGAGRNANTTNVYAGYKNQIAICWKYMNDGPEEIDYVTSSYMLFSNEELKPGGSTHVYKYGLKEGMSLEEFIELNGQPVIFLNMAFSLGHQHILGLIKNHSLRQEFQNYQIHIGYNLPEGTTTHPPDYTYLHTFSEVSVEYSSDDPNIDLSKLYIQTIRYHNSSYKQW
jgi:hypothetical protein